MVVIESVKTVALITSKTEAGSTGEAIVVVRAVAGSAGLITREALAVTGVEVPVSRASALTKSSVEDGWWVTANTIADVRTIAASAAAVASNTVASSVSIISCVARAAVALLTGVWFAALAVIGTSACALKAGIVTKNTVVAYVRSPIVALADS